MENLGIWLSLFTGIVMVLFFSPNIFRMNQGNILRNIALWLGIFVLLGWFYHLFGPFGTSAELPIQKKDTPAEITNEPAPTGDNEQPTDAPVDAPVDTYESLSKPM